MRRCSNASRAAPSRRTPPKPRLRGAGGCPFATAPDDLSKPVVWRPELTAVTVILDAAPDGFESAMPVDPYAIGDPDPNGLNSLNDLFYTVLKSDALRQLVDQALVAANPINDGSCGVFACEPDVTYNQGTLGWNTPTTTLSLIPGGLRATVYLPNVHLGVRACGTTCCIGGSNVSVSASYISATVDFRLTLQGGIVRTSLNGTPSVTVDAVALVLSDDGCAALLKEAAAVQFVMDAFGHLKAIGATDAARPLLDKAGVEPDEGVTDLGEAFLTAAAKRFWDREPNVRMLA